MRTVLVLISAIAVCLGASACDCGGGQLVSTPDMHGGSGGGGHSMVPPPMPVDAGMPPPPTGWCSNDCDCPTGSACLTTGGELTNNSCQPGTNTCDRPCSTPCGPGTTCQNGVCVAAPCTDPSCMMTMMPPGGVTVAGTYNTAYEFDIHDFASKAADIDGLLMVLNAALNGNVMCGSTSTPAGQLICLALNLIAQNIHAPPWVSQLITVIDGIFKFGGQPITAKGVMQLAEAPDGTLSAAESWSEMWMEYNSTTYNVMNNPMFGTNGNISVTVHAFGGSRSISEVVLGPRDIDFDVNKLIVNLINVAISAASNGQATDVGGLIDLILCDQIQGSTADYALCIGAASQLAQAFKLDSGLGGIHIDAQSATIYDDDNDGYADHLGRQSPVSARGSVVGSMSNGLVDGDLGAFPSSNWYGVH
jgi:hypothetical protein